MYKRQGYLVFDQEGRIADANQRFCSMVYVPFQDRCSYNIRDLTDKDTREELDMMIHGLLKKDQVLSIEARMLCLSLIHISSIWRSLYDG